MRAIDFIIKAIEKEADFITCTTTAELTAIEDPDGNWIKQNGEPNRQKVYNIIFGKYREGIFNVSPHKKQFDILPKTNKKSLRFRLKKPGVSHRGIKGYHETQKSVPDSMGLHLGVSQSSVKPLVNNNSNPSNYSHHYTDYFFQFDQQILNGKPLNNGWFKLDKPALISHLLKEAKLEKDTLTLTYTNYKQKKGPWAGKFRIGITQTFRTNREKATTVRLIWHILQLNLRIVAEEPIPKTERPISHTSLEDGLTLAKYEDVGPSKGERHRHTWDDESHPGELEALDESDIELHLAKRRKFINDNMDPNKAYHDIGPLGLSVEAEDILQSQLQIKTNSILEIHADHLDTLVQGSRANGDIVKAAAMVQISGEKTAQESLKVQTKNQEILTKIYEAQVSKSTQSISKADESIAEMAKQNLRKRYKGDIS